MSSERILVFIPTYNEAENVENVSKQIRALGIPADILFIDDNSPDGTGRIIDQMAENDQRIFVIHRSCKLGIGSAHKSGIAWAYEHGYDLLLTMDCDFTHSPKDIPTFIELATESDLVIGSRYLKPGSLKDWNLFRRTLTHIGHFLTVSLLNLSYDASGAYRLYRLDRIPFEIFHKVFSDSYSFFFESLYIISLNGYCIKEFPIDLPSRTYGHSKMAFRDTYRSVALLTYLFIKTHLDRESLLCSKQTGAICTFRTQPSKRITRDWDSYWQPKYTFGGATYDLIAAFYRKFFIKRSLKRSLAKFFKPGTTLLHAGCGGGQVDSEVCRKFVVVPMDISFPALCRYFGYPEEKQIKICGDLMDLPFSGGCFEGIYNVGVMEHFSLEQINKILCEFHKVLKLDGKIVLLWPPVFGLSVMFLKVIHYVMNDLLGRNLKLHPEEITLVRSKKQVRMILESAGFSLVDYHFGFNDFFTQVVVVGQRKSSESM